jgi:hypothetical protein
MRGVGCGHAYPATPADVIRCDLQETPPELDLLPIDDHCHGATSSHRKVRLREQPVAGVHVTTTPTDLTLPYSLQAGWRVAPYSDDIVVNLSSLEQCVAPLNQAELCSPASTFG